VSEQPVWSAKANRCSMISGATLFFTLAASAPLAWLTVTSEISWIRAFGLLVIPVSMGTWIFTTIRAVHLLGLHFWQMRSTYALLILGLVALGLVLLHSVILLLSKDHPTVRADETLYLAAALVATLATMWCAWYNWRATRSVSIATSLTIIQTVVSASIVAVLLIWMGNRRRESD
jgi:hypothetical protein